LLNERNSSHYGAQRGKGIHIQSNLRSKDFEDIAIFMRLIEPSNVKENL
jgi:hypothetical protein